MIQTYNILSLLLDYPTQQLWGSRGEVLPVLKAEGVLNGNMFDRVRSFLDYVTAFTDARSWQAAYSDLFDTSTKTNLYLFDMVYGTSRDRGQAMVDLKEEYLRAGLMPAEDELPDYLPMYLQYVANMDDAAKAHAAIDSYSNTSPISPARSSFAASLTASRRRAIPCRPIPPSS